MRDFQGLEVEKAEAQGKSGGGKKNNKKIYRKKWNGKKNIKKYEAKFEVRFKLKFISFCCLKFSHVYRKKGCNRENPFCVCKVEG